MYNTILYIVLSYNFLQRTEAAAACRHTILYASVIGQFLF